MRVIAVCLVSSVALLAACSKPAESAKPAIGPATLLGKPHPKAGLWQMAISSDAGPGISVSGQICIDAKTENSAFESSPRTHSKDCTDPSFLVSPGGGLVFETVCKVSGGRTITSHGVASGDFNNAYSVDFTTKVDPPLEGGIGDGHSRIAAHWLGPCKPGQKPGQMSGVKLGGLGRG
jgi:hypothetical protein